LHRRALFSVWYPGNRLDQRPVRRFAEAAEAVVLGGEKCPAILTVTLFVSFPLSPLFRLPLSAERMSLGPAGLIGCVFQFVPQPQGLHAGFQHEKHVAEWGEWRRVGFEKNRKGRFSADIRHGTFLVMRP
jgi:hypothetical protein